MKIKTGIYKITSPDGKVYIGQAGDYNRRISRYFTPAVSSHPRLYESVSKFGIENHEISFIHECHFEELNHWERHYQDLYDVCGPNGLNCRLTGTPEKIGYIIEQSRLNMKAGQSRRIRSDDEVDYLRERWIKINKSRAGRKVSAETLQRMSHAVKGTTCEKRQGFNHFNSKVVMNLVTGIFYGSAKHAAEAHGYNYATLKDKLSGRRNIKNNTNLSYV